MKTSPDHEYVGKTLQEVLDILKPLEVKVRVLSSEHENVITADWNPSRYNLYVNKDKIIQEICFG